MLTARELFERRRARSRTKLRKVANGQPRLTVHRSSKHIYAQIIDDQAGNTMAAASTLDADFKKASTTTANAAAAALVGKLVAERAKAKGIDAKAIKIVKLLKLIKTKKAKIQSIKE